MITINNHLGTITYSKQFFYSLIGGTVTNCFGIVGMNAGDANRPSLKKYLLNSSRNLPKRLSFQKKVSR